MSSNGFCASIPQEAAVRSDLYQHNDGGLAEAECQSAVVDENSNGRKLRHRDHRRESCLAAHIDALPNRHSADASPGLVIPAAKKKRGVRLPTPNLGLWLS